MRRIIYVFGVLAVMAVMTVTGVFAAEEVTGPDQTAAADGNSAARGNTAFVEDVEGADDALSGGNLAVSGEESGNAEQTQPAPEALPPAEETIGAGAAPAAEEPAVSREETAAGEDILMTAASAKKKPKKPGDLTGFSGYKCIILKWDKAKRAKSYTIVRKQHGGHWKVIAKNVEGTKFVDDSKAVAKTQITDIRESYATFSYRVYAVNSAGRSKPAEISGESCVRLMYISSKLKIKKKLTSHDGENVTRTFPKGTNLRTVGWDGFGKYKFYYKGNLFYVSRIACRISGSTAQNHKGQNYSKKEAQYFINGTGMDSRTRNLIWVNQYHQHLYVFKGSKGKWKCTMDWEVSTGKNNSPTTTGKLEIFKRAGSHHGIPKWNFIKSEQAIHGTYASMRPDIGAQASNGCVRNYNEYIGRIYKLPMHTRVLIF